MAYIKKKFQGISANRYAREPLEKLFAEMWQKQNNESLNHRTTLDYIWSEKLEQHNPQERSNEDYKKAATLIQWLGSTVGQCFLRDVTKAARQRNIEFPAITHEARNELRKWFQHISN